MKTCRRCNTSKPITDFHRRSSSNNKPRSLCKECAAAVPRNSLKDRDAHLRRAYGITWEQYTAILANQGGHCAVCTSSKSGMSHAPDLLVDHDHSTGLIRGLLCHPCNAAIGFFQDNPQTIRSAAHYLERNQC